MSTVPRMSSSRRADQQQLGLSHEPPPRSRSQDPSKRKEERFLEAVTPEQCDEDQEEAIITTNGVSLTQENDNDDDEQESGRVATVRDDEIRRAMTDPFDDGGLEDDTNDNGSNNDDDELDPTTTTTTTTGDWRTLPRYPVVETRNLNCWSEPSIDIFKVRGGNYFVDKKKVRSDPYLLRARGCDLFLSNDPPATNVGLNPALLSGALRQVPTFLINFRFPWGNMILYFEIPNQCLPFLRPTATNNNDDQPPSMEGMTPAERSLARFFLADEAQKNATLKLIPYVAEGPWIVRNVVTGKPAIIGNKLPVTYTYEPACPKTNRADYLEADLDVGNSSAAAKRIVSICRRYMSALTFDIGFVIEGTADDELPEQMLGSVRVHRVDPVKAPSI